MLNYQLNPKLKTRDWQRISELFELVNWGKRAPNEIRNAFNKSSFVYVVRANKEIIAFSRTMDDGMYYALLVDVVVHPDYQGVGIGKRMVDELVLQLKGYEFITLTAAPNKEGFYKKIGWRKQKSAFIVPKDLKQEKEHCE